MKQQPSKPPKSFRLPGAQTIRSRTSTITNAFVNSLMPVIRPSAAEIDEALAILGMKRGEERCAYCGEKARGWDHLRPLVDGRRPTGFITEIANLVPCCTLCNSRKGNDPWRAWMEHRLSVATTPQEVADINARVALLEKYESWRRPVRVEFERFVKQEELDRYWKMYDDVLAELSQCHNVAHDIRRRANLALGISGRTRKGRAKE